MMACFLGGYVGIQILSRALHKFIPSHVVDCEHSHDDTEADAAKEHSHNAKDQAPAVKTPQGQGVKTRPRSRTKSSLPGHMPQISSPLSKRRQSSYFAHNPASSFAPTVETEARQTPIQESNGSLEGDVMPQRPSIHQRITSRLSRLTSVRVEQCGSDGPCRGYTELCGSDCFKNLKTRGSSRDPTHPLANGRGRGSVRRIRSVPGFADETTPLISEQRMTHHPPSKHATPTAHGLSSELPSQVDDQEAAIRDDTHEDHDDSSHHHHHVPTNAFLSIGLQTSIAIALHKLPEGFITYATNHANPQLGISVFLALFIHNITEGFAMALPLYLALNSRVKAMFWSFVLGGLSQPLGAGIAALWFAIAGNGKWAPDEGIYGGMFAVTAGIMVSVALQLFSEALDLTHSRALCMIGAISGMCILGISSALTAK